MNYRHPWRGIRPWRRHSLVLMIAGLVYVAIGFSMSHVTPTIARLEALHYAVVLFPYQVWGFIFIVAGLLSILSSRWPPFSETWGYTVLTGLSAGWACFYGASVVFHQAPPANLTGFWTWTLIAFVWWAISGLVNPEGRDAHGRR